MATPQPLPHTAREGGGGGGGDGLNPSNASSASASAGPKPPRVVPRAAYEACLYTADYVEVGGGGAVWSVSSAKHGNSVAQLRDEDPATYWQSDNALPHTISIRFPQLTRVCALAMLLNAPADESYTPRRVAVRCGTHPSNAVEVAAAEVEAPDGWLLLELYDGVAAMASMATAMAAAANTEATTTDDNAGNNNNKCISPSSASSLPKSLLSPLVTASLSSATVTGGADTSPHPGENSVWCNFIDIVITENHQNGRDAHVRGVHVYGPAVGRKYTTPIYEMYDCLR